MSRGGSTKDQETGVTPSDPEAPTQLRQAQPTATDPLALGTLVGGDYRILEVMGNDESSISYKAEDVNLGVPVLLKEFAPGKYVARQPGGKLAARSPLDTAGYEAARAHFLQEAQTLVRLRHPNIVRAHRVFEDNATKYIVLDYEQGESFDAWLAGLGRAPSQAELDRLAAALLSALASMHAAGYLHGEIGPGSVLVRDGASPVLVNFAGACEMSRQGAPALPHVKERAFAAPEVLNGDADRCGPWSDLYGLAGVLYLAVTGNPPPDTDDRNGTQVATAADAARPGYREAFLSAIDHGLSLDVAKRPQSVEAWEGIRAPDEPDPEPAQPLATASTVLRHAGSAKTELASAAGAAPARTSLSHLATRVISALPEIPEETDIPRLDFERWLLPAAIISGLVGALLFSTGMNFALAAVFQVAATGLFFLRGYMPLSRYLSHTTRQTEAIVRRAEQATGSAAWMMAAILVVLTVNPLFVERHVSSNTALPLATLSAMITIPALMMAACGFLGMPVRWSMASFFAGAANITVVIFNTLLFAVFAYTVASTAPNAVIHPALQVNRYLYIIATVACSTLGVLIFLSRAAARQRIKQAALSR